MGKLDLDAPAKTFAPEIGKLQVLEGFDSRGNPKLRAPKRDVTTRMLLLHTAGFGYDFFNEKYNRLAKHHGQPSVITASKASTPLLFDPGDEWEYGCNIDWAGQVVEGTTGKRLGEVMLGVSLVPNTLTRLRLPRTVCRPLAAPVPQVPLTLMWRHNDANPALAPFLETVRSEARRFTAEGGWKTAANLATDAASSKAHGAKRGKRSGHTRRS